MKEREESLDILRLIGIFSIIYAHTTIPMWLYQLRNFGTPLLVVASALTTYFIFSHRKLKIWKFYKKRIIKLVIPAWIFAILLFFIMLVIACIQNKPFPFTQNAIISAFTFGDGMLFFWIFRIYIMLAIITPFALLLSKKIRDARRFYILVLLAYIGYELFCHWLFMNTSSSLFRRFILDFLSYTLIFLYGLRLSELKTIIIFYISLFSLLVFTIIGVYLYNESGHFIQTRDYRFPPRLYYLSYAIFFINVIYILSKKFFSRILPMKYVSWLSSNSLWIYLWHIYAYFMFAYGFSSVLKKYFQNIYIYSSIEFLFLISVGIGMTIVQKILVNRFLKTSGNKHLKFVGQLFN